jgi:hypothetical protein
VASIKLTPEEREHILSRRAIAKQREADRLEMQAKLVDALSLPFVEALPIVKRLINADFNLVWDPRVMQWCTDNSKAIVAARKDW